MIIVLGLLTLAFILFEYLALVPIGGFWSTYLFFGLIAIILICIIVYTKEKRHRNFERLKYITTSTILAYFVIALIILVANSPLFRARSYRELLPAPQESEFSSEIEPFEVSKAPIVPVSTALQVADKAISQDGTLGSRAQMGDITLQNVKGSLYYAIPLEHSGLFAWINNKDQGTPFIMVNANNKECKLVKSNIRYQPRAFFSQDLARKLFFTSIFGGYTDFTFEVDDEMHPYWTASIYKNSIGFSGAVVTGTAVIDGETGEVKIYSIEETPSWVDRIQPEGLVVDNINLRGKYIRGFSPFNNNDKIKATSSGGLVYNEGKCYYYTGVTSIGKDESSLGFYLVDTRTMETKYFKMSGATETAAINSAEGKVQNLGYKGSFPIILNIENKATYFIPLQDKNGLTKLYSMVSVEDHTVLGTGESVQEAKTAYVKALFSKNQLGSVAGNQLEITGNVKRVGSYILEGNSYYIIVIDNSDLIFTIPLNQSTKLPVTKEGDLVRIRYVDGETGNNATSIEFYNLSIKG